jgi:hypothetical protein
MLLFTEFAFPFSFVEMCCCKIVKKWYFCFVPYQICKSFTVSYLYMAVLSVRWITCSRKPCRFDYGSLQNLSHWQGNCLKWWGCAFACPKHLDLHWHMSLFCSSLPCFVMSQHPICKLPLFSFLGLYQTFRCRRIYRGWPPARTWLVASTNKKWTLPQEVDLCS